jgi:bacteriorhodopsin
MQVIFTIHSIFGERILPLLIILVAIFLTVTYKAGAARGPVARIFPVLVDIQVTLGIIYWVYMLISTSGATQAKYIGFPFILHPIIGILAAGLAHMAVGAKNPMRSLGRWAPLASLSALLVLVIANVIIGIQQ